MAATKTLNAYQQFVNATVAELKLLDEHKDKKYMQIRQIANEMWRAEHPVDPSKPVRKPRAKKEPADADAAADGEGKVKKARAPTKAATEKAEKAAAKAAKAAKKADRPARAPSAYIVFISKTLPELKAENPTVPQKELMGMAAAKWKIHKESQ